MGIASAGHVFFAVTLVALGVVGIVTGGFTPTWSGISRTLPGREALAYLCALVSLACGIGLLLPRTAVVAARVLVAFLLIWLLVVRTAWIVGAPTGLNPWWSLGDTAVMLAAAWVLFVWFADARDR